MKITLSMLLISLLGLLWMGCASGPDYAPVVATALSMEKELKTFPVIVNGNHVMDIKFQYLGNKPMDSTTELKGIPPDKMRFARFYYYEFVNLTDHTVEIFAYHSTGRMVSIDKSGHRKVAHLLFLLATATVLSQNRIALVIGNSSYKSASLKNPINDATDMTRVLKELGFKVTTLFDASYKEMFQAVRSFGNELSQERIGLFYFAGHGMQVQGRNYLIPVDADIRAEEEVTYTTLDAGSAPIHRY